MNQSHYKNNKNGLGLGKNLHIWDRIQSRLILGFLIPVFLIVILGIITYSKSRSGLIESYESSTISTMNYMAKYLNYGINVVADKAEVWKENDILEAYYSGTYKDDQQEEAKRLKGIKTSVYDEILKMESIGNLYVFSSYGKGFSGDGMVSASNLKFDQYLANGEVALLDTKKNEGLWIGSHPYLDSLSGKDTSAYAASYMTYFRNMVNEPIGCIVIDVSYEYVMKTLSGSGFPDGSIVAFITGDGREIVAGNIPKAYKFIEQNYYKDATANKKQESSSKYIRFNGDKYLFTCSRLDSLGGMICSLIPESKIIAQAREVKNIIFLVVALACLIAIALGTYIALGISSTIQHVNGVLHKAEVGDLTVYTSIDRKDEFNILGKSINDVIGSMQKLIRKMLGTSSNVLNSATVVADSSTILVTATKHISEAVSDIEKGVLQQAVDAESCLYQMSDLSGRINNLNRNTHNIEKIAGNTKQIVVSSMETVDILSRKTRDTSDITKTVISNIENLENETKEIETIIETINEITEQTNLLSLNASIEAAKAGDFGKGFSVVATEIRKLADQSLQASNKIAKIIHNIDEKTKETVNTAKNAESIVISQERALSTTVSAFTDINKHVEDLTNDLNQIVTAVEGIENAKNDTLRAIESISSTSEQTAAATEELGVTAENQMKEVNKLNDVVQSLNQDAVSLEESVRVFKIS